MSLMMGACCCGGCNGTCECMPSSITISVPAFSYTSPYSPYEVTSYAAQNVVLYLCCFVNYYTGFTNFLYRSNGIASGTTTVSSFTKTKYSFFTAYNNIVGYTSSSCTWMFKAYIGVNVAFDDDQNSPYYGEDCVVYNDMSNACPTTLAERIQLSSLGDGLKGIPAEYTGGDVYFWSPSSHPCLENSTSGIITAYTADYTIDGANYTPVSSCTVGPNPYTLKDDLGILADIVVTIL